MNKTKDNIEVELVGGIGNQLFGYFAGKYLARLNESNLYLIMMKVNLGDTIHRGSIRELNLDGYFLNEDTAKIEKIFYRFIKRMSWPNSIFSKLIKSFFHRYYSGAIGFDKNIENLQAPVRLSGYFQSWRYFEGFSKQIRNSIDIRSKSDWYVNWRNKAINDKVVMLHIRLGDYLENQNHLFGSLSDEYYKTALSKLPDDLAKNPIWVFSDDINSAKALLNNLSGFNFVWIEPPPSTSPVESLLLMSFGSANIIANSTYSWWGAMLNNRQPIVFAPSKWFKLLEDPEDLIPENWIQIQSTWR